MHPPLTPHRHQDCLEVINALKNCHIENKLSKFWGACNDHKDALDLCFKAEKNKKRSINLAKAREEQARLVARAQQRATKEAAA
mmetsp:Transcript_39346/g.66070  ORF Transcript_39346/g.66070 Transcript_39346/m.66070 type:complete len:84 (+) Transcript_39346:72-323(+)